jgi:hypothetical protein
VDVWVRGWQPVPGTRTRIAAAAERYDVQCEMFDVVEDDELGRLMMEHLKMLRAFPISRQNPRTSAATVVVLGDPKNLGTTDTPDSWRQDLELLCDAFGFGTAFRPEPTFTGTVADRTTHVIRFEPFVGDEPATHDGTKIAFSKIDARALSYAQLFHQVAVIIGNLEDEQTKHAFAPRDLVAGQRIYHRKVGNSRKFDSFDAGSATPCVRKSEFVVWSNAPKAAKGLKRRYPNFEEAWLRHCKRGMNCGMYAVFVPAGLKGSDEDDTVGD